MKGILVETDEYERVHGHKPRGTQNWIFEIALRGRVGDEIMRFGTYTDAKYGARLAAARQGLDTVRVRP